MCSDYSFDSLDTFEKKRVFLVKHALYKAYTESRKEKISFHRIINTLLLLFQSPIVLVLYREDDRKDEYGNPQKTYKEIFNTIDDPRLSVVFRKNLDKYSFNKGRKNSYLKEEYVFEYLHMISGINYGMLLFNIERNSNGHHDNDSLVFKIITKKEDACGEKRTESKLFTALWTLINKTPYSEKLGLDSHLKSILDELDKKESNSRRKLPNELCNTIINEDFSSKVILSIKEILDDVYTSIYRSPIISPRGKFPPNIFFFFRYQKDLNYIRHGNYDYNISMILPKKQEEHIRKMLFIMKENKELIHEAVPENTWKYPVTEFCDTSEIEHSDLVVMPEENEEYFYQKIAEQFWDLLFNDNNGIDKIIESLNTPFSKKSYSVADPVLSTGVLYVRKAPFNHGGKERLIEFDLNKISIDNPENIDFLRIVSTYYIMSGIAPKSKNSTLRLLLLPIRVYGTTSFCIGSITTVDNEKNTWSEDSTWDFFFHFSTDIGQKVTRKIRKDMELKYIEMLSLIMSIGLDECIRTREDDVIFSTLRFKRVINQYLVWLARFYPYDIVYFLEDRDGVLVENDKFIVIENIKLFFQIFKNPFFERNVEYDFLPKDKIIKILDIAIINALDSYRRKAKNV